MLMAQMPGVPMPLPAKDTFGRVNLAAYIDTYYAAYSGDYPAGKLVEFSTASSRANTFALNAIGLAGRFDSERVRARGEVFLGEVAETAWLGNRVKTARVGFRLAPKLWLDAGYFNTYIGVESVLPNENIFSTVTISSVNEPYFHAGGRLAYQASDALALELWVVNRFTGFDENNGAKTVATVLRYTFNERYRLTYDGTFGRESPGEVAPGAKADFRQFHNFNLVATPLPALDLLLDVSAFIETNTPNRSLPKSLRGYNGLGTLRYHVNDLAAVALRASFLTGEVYGEYNDLAISLQLKPSAHSYLRLEGRRIGSDRNVFGGDEPSARRYDLVLSCGIRLGHSWALTRQP